MAFYKEQMWPVGGGGGVTMCIDDEMGISSFKPFQTYHLANNTNYIASVICHMRSAM